jgi:nitroreductase
MPLEEQAIAADQLGLLEGLTSTRAIRRYTEDAIPEVVLRDMLFSATRAPSGSNRQPFRFVVLTDSPIAQQAKSLIGVAAQVAWAEKRKHEQYDQGSGTDPDSPKSRMARTMQHYVDNFHCVPCLVLPCMKLYRQPHPTQGASIYPAVQNLMLAARGLGYGGVITGFHHAVETELKALLEIPEDVFVSCTVTLGKPAGRHGAVRRRPLQELVYADRWESSATWAVDPPGTRYTSAGPPKNRA